MLWEKPHGAVDCKQSRLSDWMEAILIDWSDGRLAPGWIYVGATGRLVEFSHPAYAFKEVARGLMRGARHSRENYRFVLEK